MPFCTQCGKPIKEGTKFCTSCGKPIDIDPNEPVVSPPPVVNVQPEVKAVEKSSTQSTADYDAAFPKKSNKGIIIGIVAVVCIGAAIGAYFLFFNKKAEVIYPTLYVLPESLKLRSSQYDNSDANILSGAPYGSPISILSDEGDWAKVKYNDIEGYMRSRYLANQRDFFETDAIIHTIGRADTIRETRFKKSLLAYFRQHNYKPPFVQTTDYIQQAFLSDTSSYKTKEEWKIAQPPMAFYSCFIRGKFTNTSKSGMAVIIEKSNSSSTRKLLIFNYDDAENELSVSEFNGKFQSIYMLNKSTTCYINRVYQALQYNAVRADEADTITIFVYNGNSMLAYVQPTEIGD